MPSVLGRFLDFNRRLCNAVGDRVESSEDFYRGYDALVVGAIRAVPPGSAIVDLGGGRHCSFAGAVDRSGGTRIIAVDISQDELDANGDVDDVRLADAAAGLPFADGEVSLLVSRTLLEHITNVEAAVENIGRVVGPSGRTIHLVPCRNALFAIAARVIPWRFAEPAVHALVPGATDVIRFEPFYDHCAPGALEQLFRDAGFSVRSEVCYAQTDYFRAFFPAFLLVWAYQAALRRLDLRRLAAYVIVDASRQPGLR